MKTAAIFFCAVILCVNALPDDQVRQKWQEFQETYQRSYRSPVEAQKRFSIFKKHLEEIEEHNKLYDEGKVSWKEGINQFSDLTEEEMKEYVSHGILHAVDEEDIQQQWDEFQKTFKKSYRSPVEAQKRFQIFRNNVIEMEKHNELYEQGLVSDKQGINRFSDWTEEEFKEYVNKGLISEDTAVSSDDDDFQNKWNEFQKTYKKSYRSPVEAQRRFKIFKNNVIKMEEHNKLYEKSLVSDKQGINRFSDWTEEEFKEYVNKGLIHEEPAVSSGNDDIQSKWEEFQKTYKKSYRSPVEAQKRFQIFRNNIIEMEKHNELYEQGLVTDKQGINRFSDWTEEEFKEYVNKGLIHEDTAVSSGNDEIQSKWEEFQKTYKKSYRSPVEAQKRFQIFRNNVIEMEKHNDLYEQGLVSDKQGINRFSDWTEEEFKTYVNKGLIHINLAAISEQDEIQKEWNTFQKTYKKSYRSPVEAKKRFEIFKNNVMKIKEHNELYEQGLVSDKQGINRFSDWTEEEFKEYVNKGLIHEDVEIQAKWDEFQKTYKKSYRSPVEAQKRFEIFRNNVIEMEEHNHLYEQGLVSDKQGINRFSDWTKEEFEEYVSKGLIYKHVALSSQDEDIQSKWSEFQKTYKKSYRSPVEAKKRFEIFKNNVMEIEEHNELYEQGLVSDKQGINRFSDWTEQEFKEYVNKGLIHGDAAVSIEDEIQAKWNDFQKTYKKSYRSPVEAKKRFEIFRKNVIQIQEHNDLYEQGLVSDKQGINRFSDWTREEFEDYLSKGLIHDSAVGDDEDEMLRRWTEFQQKYGKTYRSSEEAKKRYVIFKENVRKIDEHNELYREGKTSYEMGINMFTDWTYDEYLEWLKTH